MAMWAVQPVDRGEGRRVALVLAAGAAVAMLLGVYGRVHTPAGVASTTVMVWTFDLGPSMLAFKSWLTTTALLAAVLQVAAGLRLRDAIRWPVAIPLWLGDAHRLLGSVILLLTVPVAYHCLWSLGFRTTDARVLLHSAVGCFFYGVFLSKVLAVRVPHVPDRWVPIAGGAIFAALVIVWATSAAFFLGGRIG